MNSERVAKIKLLLAKKKQEEAQKLESRPELKKYTRSYKKANRQANVRAKHGGTSPTPAPVASTKKKRLHGSTISALRSALRKK